MGIYRRGNVWWIDVYKYGANGGLVRIRKSLRTDDEQRARMIEQTMIGVRRGVTPRQQAIKILDLIMPRERTGVALADLVTWYEKCLTDERIDISARTKKQRLNNLRALVAWLGSHTRALTCDDVGSEEAFQYSQDLGRGGILGKTLNSYVGDLSTVWKMLMKRSKVDSNPWTLVRVRRDRDKEHTGRAFTHDEFDRLVETARKFGFEWDGMVTIAAYTGLRMPDVAQLKWSEIDLEPIKTRHYGIEVHVPIHPKVLAYLKTRTRNSMYVMPYRATHPASYSPRNGDVRFSQILAGANVGKVRERDKLSFHCFRHTFVSWLAEAGVAQDVRMELAGHTNADTHAIYTHVNEQAKAAIAKLK